MDSEEVLFQLGGWEKGYLNHKKYIITFYTGSQTSTCLKLPLQQKTDMMFGSCNVRNLQVKLTQNRFK